MTVPQPPVGTTDQILIKLGEMGVQLAHIEEKLNALNNVSGDHEQRIRKLEAWRYGLPLSGLLATGSAAASIWALLHG